MPTAAMRQGDFSKLVDAQGQNDTVRSNDNRRYGCARSSRITRFRSTAEAHWLRIFTASRLCLPIPMLIRWCPPTGLAWASTTEIKPQSRREWTTGSPSGTSSSSGTRTILPAVVHTVAGENAGPGRRSPTTLDGKANATTEGGKNDSGVVSWTHTFSPTFFSETIFGVQRDNRNAGPAVFEDLATQLGLSNPFKGLGFPRIVNTGFGMDYDSFGNRNIDFSRIYNLDLNFTKLRGRHQLQFGARWRYESVDILA